MEQSPGKVQIGSSVRTISSFDMRVFYGFLSWRRFRKHAWWMPFYGCKSIHADLCSCGPSTALATYRPRTKSAVSSFDPKF